MQDDIIRQQWDPAKLAEDLSTAVQSPRQDNLVAVDRVGCERRKTEGHVLAAAPLRTGVADPLTRPRDDRACSARSASPMAHRSYDSISCPRVDGELSDRRWHLCSCHCQWKLLTLSRIRLRSIRAKTRLS